MKTKQLLILGVIFVVLAIVVLLFENPFGQSEYEKKVETATPLFPNFNKEEVAQIEIVANAETTTLSKQDSNWIVASMNNYPADSEGITELLSKVAEFKNTQRVSNNPDKQAEFEVDSTGVEAKLMGANGTLLAHLFIGKTTSGFLSSYVRVADSMMSMSHKAISNPFSTKGHGLGKIGQSSILTKVLSRNLIFLHPEEVVELRLDADGTWQMLKPVASAVKQDEVDSLLTTFSALDTDDFAEMTDDLSEYGLDTPQSTVSAVHNDGTTVTLHIGKEEDGKLYVKRDDEETVFRLFKSNVDRLIKKADTLKAEEAPPEVEIE